MPQQFFTDPAQYNPPSDHGPFLIVASKSSVQNPGRVIPDTIIGMENRFERITLTSAQLLALKGADVQIVPQAVFTPSGVQGKPGVGLAYAVESVHMRFNFLTTAYTLNAGTLKLYQGPSANNIPLTADLSALLTQVATFDNIDIPILPTGPQTQANIENQPITIGNTGTAQFTLGDGTLDVILQYTVVQM